MLLFKKAAPAVEALCRETENTASVLQSNWQEGLKECMCGSPLLRRTSAVGLKAVKDAGEHAIATVSGLPEHSVLLQSDLE